MYLMPPGSAVTIAKRQGLSVDLARLSSDGDGWLTQEDRYALKTRGVCAQLQPGVFMIRVRVPGGRLPTRAARGLAGVASTYGGGWLHVSTRQNVELHHVDARNVPQVLSAVEAIGLTTRSACGHTMRNVMACPLAGVGLDEPFDCYADARMVSDVILARSAQLNCQLPSRLNISFGGCPDCAAHARLNDIAFVSVLRGGVPGYELHVGGSLGTMPRLAHCLEPFVARSDVLATAEALVDVFVAHGDLEHPAKGRMKFLIDAVGIDRFTRWFTEAREAARRRSHPTPLPVIVPDPGSVSQILANSPAAGWSEGVRPHRTAGFAIVTVRVPLGDLDGEDVRWLADIADAMSDQTLYLTRNQNVVLREVSVGDVAALQTHLARRGLGTGAADAALDVRACTGSAVCSLAITAAPTLGARLLKSSPLARNSGLRVHISGCPNSCAQHQAADIGLSGAKVRVDGETRLGYHVWVGADLGDGCLGNVIGRTSEEEAPAVVDAIIGAWEALRRRGEPLATTIRRVGVDAFGSVVEARAHRQFRAGVDDVGGAEEPDYRTANR
jgi:ferredoxin-nitrite reductase/sulfite reductase (ferredoxin)